MNNEIPDNLLPPPTRNARTPDVRTADILSAQTGPTPAAQITRTADILSAQAGQTRVALARLPAALGSR